MSKSTFSMFIKYLKIKKIKSDIIVRSRIIGSLIVKDKIVVQSFEFKILPIGSVNICLENLDNWKVDEIIIKCIDRSKKI